MARKNKKRKQQNTSKVDEQQKIKNLENNVDAIMVKNNIPEEELTPKQKVTDDNVTLKTAQDLYYKVVSVEKVLEKRKTEYEKLKAQTEEEKKSLQKKIQENDTLRTELKIRLNKYNDKLVEVNKLQVENGFSSIIDKSILDTYSEQFKEHEKSLVERIKELNTKHTDYIKALSKLNAKKLELEKYFQEKLVQAKVKLEKDYQTKFNQKEKELEEATENIGQLQRQLNKKQKELNFDIEDFQDEKNYLVDKAREKVANEIEDLTNKIENLQEKNTALYQEVEKLKDELKYLGMYTAEDIMIKLRRQSSELFELKEKLALSPDSLNVDLLKRLQNEKASWQEKLRESQAQLNDYKTRYENQKLQIGVKERLEYEKEQLELRIKLQQTVLEELKEEVNDLTNKTNTKTTFVNCSEMDENYKKAPENSLDNKISKTWLRDMQHAIAGVTDNKLFYSEDVLRSFISGLAMSRFSILQGISGTGKTSLPKAFAKAIGGNFGIVEVQSGWKDRQDLIGYYNTFEKKYYEGEFMKLLYMAGTPKYKDKPFFIILDEMNLSHPEHYFADMLSVMEETNPDKQILKISDRVNDVPQLMIPLETGGIGLKIPQNVWFIGTANHDETTLQFAPKTYDRANVLEMPINIETFKIKKVNYTKIAIPNTNLLNFFSSKSEDKEIEKIKTYLDGNFKAICNKLGIGWGNRLKKQIKLFIPTFNNLGGSIANAFDHVIASKILRSVKGRYDLQAATLTEMKEELEINFKKIFKGDAMKSLEIINNELNRLN